MHGSADFFEVVCLRERLRAGHHVFREYGLLPEDEAGVLDVSLRNFRNFCGGFLFAPAAIRRRTSGPPLWMSS